MSKKSHKESYNLLKAYNTSMWKGLEGENEKGKWYNNIKIP